MSTLHFFDADKGSMSSLGSLEKSVAIQHLLETPREQRDPRWIEEFLTNIDACNLKLGEPEVAIANDGYPYMNAQTVSPNTSFSAFVIRNELDQLIRNGFGLVVNAGAGYPDWLFSCGDLLNLKLNGEFYTEDGLFSAHGEDFHVSEDEQILVGQPSAEILPDIARQHIREYLESVGFRNGKVLLMARNYEDEEEACQDLVFNITPSSFSTHEQYEQVMHTIAWFLPRHYAIAGLDDETISNGFERI